MLEDAQGIEDRLLQVVECGESEEEHLNGRADDEKASMEACSGRPCAAAESFEMKQAAGPSTGDLVYSSIIGMLVAVAWAYLLEQQVDPNGKCPASNCWVLVSLLGTNTLAGAFYIPALSLTAMRRLASREPVIDATAGTRRYSIALFRREVHRRLQRLTTDASSTCWSCGASSFVFNLLKQMEFAASGGDSQSFVRPVAHAGDTSARRHLLHHRLPILLACMGICVGVITLSFATTLAATRRLAKETRPYFVEVWLLLRTGLFYSCAYAVATTTGLLFFSPFDLGWGGERLRLFAVALRALLFWYGARQITQGLPRPPSDAAIALLQASTDIRSCASHMCYDILVIVAAIGLHDLVVFFVVDFIKISLRERTALFFVYAFAALGTVLIRRRRARRRQKSGENENAAFLDVFERWLVCFAWSVPLVLIGTRKVVELCRWVPYKYVLVQAWDLFGARRNSSSSSNTHKALYVFHRLERFVWQLIIAVSLPLGFATFLALPTYINASSQSSTSIEHTPMRNASRQVRDLPPAEETGNPMLAKEIGSCDIELVRPMANETSPSTAYTADVGHHGHESEWVLDLLEQ